MITLQKAGQRVALACWCAGVLAACSDGDDGADGRKGADGAPGRSALIAIVPEPPGGNCTSGGSRIDSGPDENANRVLDPNEVVGTQYVCNGTGASAGQSLVEIGAEPSGANCANGGQKFSAGRDGDGDGALDASEVSSVGYACNGSSGVGANRILTALVSEPAGAHCGNAGIKVTSGPDANGNDTLDGTEIVSTQYVCNGANGSAGAPGQSALIATLAESPGVNCTYGGTRIAAGLDINGNGTLDASETTATSYACNGAPGPGITWTEVTGASVQTTANTGYLVSDDTQQPVLTLPASPPIGSVVQVSGMGRGGWRIAQNASQYVVTSSLPGGYIRSYDYTRESVRNWSAVACSNDCSVIVAAVYGGQLYRSTNGGETWAAQESTRQWSAVAASATGKFLYAVVDGGAIYRSDGESYPWRQLGAVGGWRGIATSADGSKVIAVAPGDQIYTSVNYGATFTARESVRNWVAVASSADGSKLIAADLDGQLYTSIDSGATWTPRETNRHWVSVASSADGNKLAAVAGSSGPSNSDARLFTSADGGITWIERRENMAADWTSIASSADGTRLTAVNYGERSYTSTDSGVTWTAHEPSGFFLGVALSADGMKMAGAALGVAIQLVKPATAPQTATGAAGSIVGGQHDAIALQYAGGGKFIVLNYSGTFVVN